jgi:hypothetical protein
MLGGALGLRSRETVVLTFGGWGCGPCDAAYDLTLAGVAGVSLLFLAATPRGSIYSSSWGRWGTSTTRGDLGG